MNIFINGQLATLKKGSSFEYVSENRFFTNADGYTLAIELPLKDCPQNIGIFGHINRKDSRPPSELMLCELRDGNFCKRGSIAITEINDVSVKVQFLEGRSVQNCAVEFDDIYINELDLGYNTYEDSQENTMVKDSHSWPLTNLSLTMDDGQEWQALPWVNNYSGNIQNDINFQSGAYKMQNLSFQCYLLALTKRIFNAVGYTCNLSTWEGSYYRHLLCCNTLPAAWDITNYAQALPHWSLTDFIGHLEQLMYCEFDVSHTDKTIKMQFSSSAINSAPSVLLDKVLNDYTVTEEEEETCTYKEACNLKYASCDHEMWKYYDCRWFLNSLPTHRFRIKHLNTLQDLLTAIPSVQKATGLNEDECVATCECTVYYVEAVQRYYTARRIKVEKIRDYQPPTQSGPGIPAQYAITLLIQPLNTFGASIYDEEANTTEIAIVPVWLDDLGDTTKGLLYFLDCGEYEDDDYYRITQALEEGEKETPTYHDKLYVGFWPGTQDFSKYPHPFIDSVDINTDRTVELHPQSLALRDEAAVGYDAGAEIKRGRKYTFKFLSDTMPNVRSQFYIHGKRYLCKKITATFTENGMSQLFKGVFYELN